MKVLIVFNHPYVQNFCAANFTASSLYSRLNFLHCIHALQFHWKHLNSVSTKPAAGHRIQVLA